MSQVQSERSGEDHKSVHFERSGSSKLGLFGCSLSSLKPAQLHHFKSSRFCALDRSLSQTVYFESSLIHDRPVSMIRTVHFRHDSREFVHYSYIPTVSDQLCNLCQPIGSSYFFLKWFRLSSFTKKICTSANEIQWSKRIGIDRKWSDLNDKIETISLRNILSIYNENWGKNYVPFCWNTLLLEYAFYEGHRHVLCLHLELNRGLNN